MTIARPRRRARPLVLLLALAAAPRFSGAATAEQPAAASAASAATVTALPGSARNVPARNGVAAGADLEALARRPELIAMDMRRFKDPASGETRIEGGAEVHGVFDAPLERLVAAMDDRVGQLAFSPRLLSSIEELRDGPRVVFLQDIGIEFLGVRVAYAVRSEAYREELPGGAVAFRTILLDSLDGKLYASTSSWYFEPVTVEGRRLVYIRYHAMQGIRRPGFGMEGLIKAFTPSEMKGLMATLAREARKRSGAK